MEDTQSSPSIISLAGCQGLEQFLLLAKTAKGPAAAELVKQVLNAPGVYVFKELLETECMRQLAEGPEKNYVQLLELFAYGTYKDYKREASSLPPLTPLQINKLKHLSIVSLAAKCQTIPYSTLLEELDIQDLRVLEDLIIEGIYGGLMQAKLDQRNAQLEVECFIGRDTKQDELDPMVEILENWCANCALVLDAVETEMSRADKMKLEGVKEKERHDDEVKMLWQTLKVAANSDGEDQMQRDGGGLGGLFSTGQLSPKKGLRGSAMKFGKK